MINGPLERIMGLPVMTCRGCWKRREKKKRHREKAAEAEKGNMVNELTAQALTNPNPPIMLLCLSSVLFLPFEPGETQFVLSLFPGFPSGLKRSKQHHINNHMRAETLKRRFFSLSLVCLPKVRSVSGCVGG